MPPHTCETQKITFGSHLLSYGLQGSSSRQAWFQVPLPAESSYGPYIIFFLIRWMIFPTQSL